MDRPDGLHAFKARGVYNLPKSCALGFGAPQDPKPPLGVRHLTVDPPELICSLLRQGMGSLRYGSMPQIPL